MDLTCTAGRNPTGRVANTLGSSGFIPLNRISPQISTIAPVLRNRTGTPVKYSVAPFNSSKFCQAVGVKLLFNYL